MAVAVTLFAAACGVWRHSKSAGWLEVAMPGPAVMALLRLVDRERLLTLQLLSHNFSEHLSIL